MTKAEKDLGTEYIDSATLSPVRVNESTLVERISEAFGDLLVQSEPKELQAVEVFADDKI